MKNLILGILALGWIPTLLVMGGVWEVGAGNAGQPGSVETPGRTPVMVTRMYTGEDGQTHAEEIEWPLGAPNGATELAAPIPVESLQFRRTSTAYFLDFHNAPRAQFVVTLSGRSEVEFGDGTKVLLDPGHILLAEDTVGQGHISRAVGDEDRISLFIPLSGPLEWPPARP